MGTKLSNNKGKNLYEFWDKKVIKHIAKELDDMGSNLLINLASVEYSSVLGKIPETIQVVSPVFKDKKGSKHKIVSFYAKKARGVMARWIIDNKIINAAKLSAFSEDGYYFSKSESTESMPVFLRD
jgi:cytoplasmic iron level regulating protein YaaA (DUF328/UPF0246 family)